MSDDERALWAPLITERREQLDLTQEQLATVAGVAPKTIYNIEAGGRVPQPKTLRKVQDALGLSTDIEVARERVAEGRERREAIEATSRVRRHLSEQAAEIMDDPEQLHRALLAILNLQTDVMKGDYSHVEELVTDLFWPAFTIFSDLNDRARLAQWEKTGGAQGNVRRMFEQGKLSSQEPEDVVAARTLRSVENLSRYAKQDLEARRRADAQAEEDNARAARQVGRTGKVKQARDAQDQAGEPEAVPDDDFEPR